MDFNDHSALEGQHAFLSPSNYHWVNYDDQKLRARWSTIRAARKGVALHEYAATAITLGRKQPKNRDTVNMYINDAIGFKMTCEQMLFYSPNAFGTVDAISFFRNTLRIHDLKTGMTKTSFMQLRVYAALFCLEYSVDPFDIKMEFRIYQNEEVLIEEGDPEEVSFIMDRFEELDMAIEALKNEEGSL